MTWIYCVLRIPLLKEFGYNYSNKIISISSLEIPSQSMQTNTPGWLDQTWYRIENYSVLRYNYPINSTNNIYHPPISLPQDELKMQLLIILEYNWQLRDTFRVSHGNQVRGLAPLLNIILLPKIGNPDLWRRRRRSVLGFQRGKPWYIPGNGTYREHIK